ncbi:MAG: flagellar basal body P-ring formation protein FlgA [Myxococcales bacterium]|nr:flagellar basal body P-ring formation protein FlgA [Myxococcales bacterium]
MNKLRLLRAGILIAVLWPGGAALANVTDASELSERIRREVAVSCLVSENDVQVPAIDGLARRIPPTQTPTLRVAGEEPCAETVPVVVEWLFRTSERVVVQARIRRPTAIAVAAREIARGEEIRREDLRLETRHASRALRGAAADPDRLVGLRARRRIARGAPIRSNWLEVIPVISKGDRVRLLYSVGDLIIESTGRAEEDAAHGETLRAVNLDSKKRIVGRVERPGVIRVDF